MLWNYEIHAFNTSSWFNNIHRVCFTWPPDACLFSSIEPNTASNWKVGDTKIRYASKFFSENETNKIISYKLVTYRKSFIPEERSIKESIENRHLKHYITVPYSDPEYKWSTWKYMALIQRQQYKKKMKEIKHFE